MIIRLNSENDHLVGAKPRGFGVRHLVCLMGFIMSCNLYMMRVSISVAIVAMVNHTAVDLPENENDSERGPQCDFGHHEQHKKEDGEFVWDSYTQGLVLSSFFWGYVVTQFPGGVLAEKFGGKWIIGLSILFSALFTFLTPIAARANFTLLLFCRIAAGLAQGVYFPALHSFLGRNWIPACETTFLLTLTVGGTTIGAVIGMFFSGLIASLYGWPAVFYIYGITGVLAFMAWTHFVPPDPSQATNITSIERKFIENSLKKDGHSTELQTPWRLMLTSAPFIAIALGQLGSDWGFYTLLTQYPMYLKSVMGFDLQNNGFLSALPYLLSWVFGLGCGFVADVMRSTHMLSTTATRKLMSGIGTIIPATVLIVASYTGCDRDLTVALITCGVMFSGACLSGFFVNDLDLSPNFAGSMVGVLNCIGNFCGIFVPYFAGIIISDKHDTSQWQSFFILAATIYFVTIIIYFIFGSGELQPWNNPGHVPDGGKEMSKRPSSGYQSDHVFSAQH